MNKEITKSWEAYFGEPAKDDAGDCYMPPPPLLYESGYRQGFEAAKKTLERLALAADSFQADQSHAPDPNCGLVQPITVKEGEELCAALSEAWDLIYLTKE